MLMMLWLGLPGNCAERGATQCRILYIHLQGRIHLIACQVRSAQRNPTSRPVPLSSSNDKITASLPVIGANMKIMVRNLSRDTTEAELLVMFSEYGSVQYCTLVMDKETGKSKGFGFVEMPRAGEARAAIKELNYLEVDGNRIRVKKAEKSINDPVDKEPDASGS